VEKYFYAINYLVIIVFGIFFINKIKESLQIKLFLYFLIYSLFTEVVGGYVGRILGINNNWIYNTWNIVNHLFYAFFFMSFMVQTNKKRIIKSFILLYVLFSLVSIFFINSYFDQVLINNIIVGSILIVLVILLYYAELLNSDTILNINKSLVFWISIGALLSNIVLIPVWVFAEFFSYQGIFRFFIIASNILMSLCFITGFIVSKKEYNN